MANSFGLLLAIAVILFIIARCIRDAKAFGKWMAALAFGLIVGAGVKVAAKELATTSPEKTIVVSTESAPMYNTATPLVAEPAVMTYLDCTSKDNADRDSVVTDIEGLPTERIESAYEDDS